MTKQNVAGKLPAYMQDVNGAPVTGLAFGDISVKYAKEGATGLTTKTINAGNWTEVGQGLYDISFTGVELDTIRFFKYVVTGTGALQYPGLAQISANLVDDLRTKLDEIEAKIDIVNANLDSVKVTVEAIKVENFSVGVGHVS